MDARTFAPNSYCTTRLQSEEEIFCINFKFARYAWNFNIKGHVQISLSNKQQFSEHSKLTASESETIRLKFQGIAGSLNKT